MNFKLLFPTYRTRERFVRSLLEGLSERGRAINVGAGEGDLDAMIASFSTELESCDVNADDVAHARALNAHVPNAHYSVQDGGALGFADASFQLAVCLEVIEHVEDPKKLLSEIARVLVPNGALVLTCPNVRFPVTYDPVNALLAARGTHAPFGAYGYGHSWLVDEDELERWLAEAGLRIERKERLNGTLVGAVECYWPGLLQRVLKANAGNAKVAGNARGLRPRIGEPPLVSVVDGLIALDGALAKRSRRSIGLGYVVRKT